METFEKQKINCIIIGTGKIGIDLYLKCRKSRKFKFWQNGNLLYPISPFAFKKQNSKIFRIDIIICLLFDFFRKKNIHISKSSFNNLLMEILFPQLFQPIEIFSKKQWFVEISIINSWKIFVKMINYKNGRSRC